MSWFQQISRDFKDTLEQEIGLDELRESNPTQPVYKSPTKSMRVLKNDLFSVSNRIIYSLLAESMQIFSYRTQANKHVAQHSEIILTIYENFLITIMIYELHQLA